MPTATKNAPGPTDEQDDLSSAPESGQVVGGREDPWEGEEETVPPHAWPSERHATPKDEL